MTSCADRDGTSVKKTLKEIVTYYISVWRTRTETELKYIAIQRSFGAAIMNAAMAKQPTGKRHPHQRRIPHKVLSASAKALMRTDLLSARDFSDLHARVEKAIGPIRGIGPLTVYDIAQRIGAFLGLFPKDVYLHAGTRTEAKTLGLNYLAA